MRKTRAQTIDQACDRLRLIAGRLVIASQCESGCGAFGHEKQSRVVDLHPCGVP
jgi:hypothetical protein